MASLISKPGLTNASTLSIPKDWSPSWFRGLIANQLTGGDVRNAVGSGGISVRGNITSPFATIGFVAPVTIPAQFTVTANGGVALEVDTVGRFSVGTTPQPWGTTSFSFGNCGMMAFPASTGNHFVLYQAGNAYFDGANWIYNTANTATLAIVNSAGSFIVETAPTGAIGGTVSFSIAFQVGASSVFFPSAGTTASAANAFLNSASSPANQLLRSTSSLRYKANVQPLIAADLENLMRLRPITYTSTCAADDQTEGHFGLIAEEVDLIDKRLVNYHPTTWCSRPNKDGTSVLEPVSDCPVAPDSVRYERLVVLLVGAVQALTQRITVLESSRLAQPLSLSPAPSAPPPSITNGGTVGLTGTAVFTGTPVPYTVVAQPLSA